MAVRGDVIVVDFPFADRGGSKIRPAVVVQNNSDNRRLRNTVVAMVTGNLRHAHEPTQILVDPTTPGGSSSGLHGPSVVKCGVLVTVDQTTILRTLGRLSGALMQEIDQGLRAALDL